MKALLVQPYAGYELPNLVMKLSARLPAYPNLTLQQLAGICPEDYAVEAIDENRGDKINFEKEYDLVVITCRTATVPRAYKIGDEFRCRGIPVVICGYHPSALPEEAKQHVDSVVIGEADISLSKIFKDVQKDKLKPYYKSDPVDPKLIPSTRRDIIDYYLPLAAIETTRGCPVNCDFCFVHKVEGKIHRKRPIENVIDEIKSIKQKNIFFYDSSLTIEPRYTKNLFKNMISLNKRFACYGNVNVLAKDEEFLKLASEAGCVSWFVGFESISQKSLDETNKKINQVDKHLSAIKKIKKYDMAIVGSFIFGFDNDTPNIFDTTYNTINKWSIDAIEFRVLTPFPGTALYKRLKKEGRILTEDWGKYNFANVVFQPKNMSVEELFEGTRWIIQKFYSIPNIIKRFYNSIEKYRDIYMLYCILQLNFLTRQRYKKLFNF